MIPDKSHRKWKDVVIGQTAVPTDNLGLQMFLKRTTVRFKAEAPAAEVTQAVAELHAFFTKYERILQKELAIISR